MEPILEALGTLVPALGKFGVLGRGRDWRKAGGTMKPVFHRNKLALFMQDDCQKSSVDSDFAVVVDEA
jgi:hypothetical protein